MLIAVFGTPSPMTYWGLHAIRTMVNIAAGDHRLIEATVIDDFRKAWAEGDNKKLIFFADSPDAEIARIFLSLNIPVVVFTDAWSDVVGFSMAARDFDFLSALRFTSLNLAALQEFFSDARTRIVRRGCTNNLRGMLDLIANCCELQMTHQQLDEALQRLVPAGSDEQAGTVEGQLAIHIPKTMPPGAWIKTRRPEDHQLVEALFGDRGSTSQEREFKPLTWPRELFLTPPQGAALTTPIQLMGRSRFIVYGPYLYLPRGRWTALVSFEVGENISGNSLLVDVLSERVLAFGRMELPASGSYEFELEFETNNPRIPVELRFILEHGAIEGWLDLTRVIIRSQGSAAAIEAKNQTNDPEPRPRVANA